MPASTEIFYNVDGVYAWNGTIPYDLYSVGKREMTDILALAAGRAMDRFIRTRLKDRFNGYAMRELGYSVNPDTWKKKRAYAGRVNPEAIKPNVYTGRTKNAVLNGARAQTRSIGGATKGLIKTQLIYSGIPGYINAQRTQVTNKVLQRITIVEAQEMRENFVREVVLMMATAMTRNVATRKGTIVSRTSIAPSMRSALGSFNRVTTTSARRSTGVPNAI